MRLGKKWISCVCGLFFLGVLVFAPATGAWADADEEALPINLVQKLGRLLYFDNTLSINMNQSCSSCHDPSTGFADPDQDLPVSEGSIPGLFGTRNAPTASYAAFTPPLHFDEEEGLWVGGQFWDGRAATLEDQAEGPPVNPVEMGIGDIEQVVRDLASNLVYVVLFDYIYSIDLHDPEQVDEAYVAMAHSIEEFEETRPFTRFNSKFDFYIANEQPLSAEEEFGRQLFMNEIGTSGGGFANCVLCHVQEFSLDDHGTIVPPLFTDFTYDNLGVPVNNEIARLHGEEAMPIDLGLGVTVDDEEENGKFKVMGLRNIAKTAPYAHNGLFKSLEDIVHFYNTRDVLPACDAELGSDDPGFGATCWPVAEYPETVNHDELGDLGMSPTEEAALVAFLEALSDNPQKWVPSPFPPPEID